MVYLPDSHVHLDAFNDIQMFKDLTLMAVGTNLQTSAYLLKLYHLKCIKNLFIAAGHLPINVLNQNIDYDKWIAFFQLQSPFLTAIGEIGVDSKFSMPINLQWEILEFFIHQSITYKLPISLHCSKDLHDSMKVFLKPYKTQLKGVIHGFSGSYEQASYYLDLGFYIGVGGVICFDHAKKTQATVARLPICNILLETDSPFYPILPIEKNKTTPKCIEIVFQKLQRLHQGIESPLLRSQLQLNFNKFVKNDKIPF